LKWIVFSHFFTLDGRLTGNGNLWFFRALHTARTKDRDPACLSMFTGDWDTRTGTSTSSSLRQRFRACGEGTFPAYSVEKLTSTLEQT
jgi:hypothetical protein